MILYFIAEKCLYTRKKQIEFYREEKIIGKKDSVKNTKRRAKILKEEQIIIKNDPKQMNVKQSIDSISEQFENPEELLNYFKKQRRKKNNDFSKEDLYDIQNYIKKHEHEIKFKNNPNKTTLTDEIPKKTKLEEVSFEIPKDLPIDKTPEKPLSNNKQKRAKQKQKKELFKNNQKKYYSDPEYRKRKIAADCRLSEKPLYFCVQPVCGSV